MLYHILIQYQEQFGFLRVFRYITFRTMGAILTALFLAFILGPWLIRRLGSLQMGQPVRDDGPSTHLRKAGTPTMGGVLILFCCLLSTLLWARLDNAYVWISVLVAIVYGGIGFLDDYLKVVRHNSKGLSAGQKFKLQILAGLAVGLFLVLGEASVQGPLTFLSPLAGKLLPLYTTDFRLPMLKEPLLHLGLFYIFLSCLVLVAASNAVNITDGLDGLAICPVMISMLTFAILAYCAGHYKIAAYLNIPFIHGVGEQAIVAGAVFGASLGFLWFNTYPAQVFMGDVGALSLGALLGWMALCTKNEILLLLIGGIFVLETLSVMIQVFSYKIYGQRVFKMAPLHHHFELKGWAEPKVIVRFWIISIILALLSLATLKLR